VPVKFIGVGEGIDDLQPFNPHAFADGLFNDLPEDFEEEEIDLSKIREEYVPAEVTDEREELAKAVGEIFSAMAEINAEEIAEDEEEAIEEVEEISEEIVEPVEEAVEKIEETVEEITEEVVEEAVEEKAEEITEEVTKKETEEKEEPKKKKGFFGRLFG
jgi:signal recognition particle GTPase